MQFPNSLIIFDIETTGFSGTKNKCIEIGAIKIVEGQVISTFQALLNHGISADEYIPDINGITYQEVQEKGLNPEVVFDEFMEFIKGDYKLVGHNVLKFDIPFLKGNFPLFHRLVMDNVLDTAALYKAKKLNLDIPTENIVKFMTDILGKVHYGVKYSVDTACEEFKIDKSKVTQHRALGDCYLTHEIYKNVCLLADKNTTQKKEDSREKHTI